MTDGDKLAQMEWQKWYDALDGYFLRRQLKKIEKD